MKCSLDVSNFLKEMSSLSHSVVFLYFFALIAEKGFLFSSCYSLELCIQMLISFLFSFVFHLSSVTQSCPILCNPMDCSTPGLPVQQQLPEPSQTRVHQLAMPSNHLICCPLLLLPPIFSIIRVFSNESALRIKWPKYCSFSFNISPSNEYPGLISFRMDWLDHLAVQGTRKSLLQHHSSKASILWCSAFFTVQLSHLYMTTGKTIGRAKLQRSQMVK